MWWGEVSADRWERAQVGDPIKIVYLRSNPAKSRLAEAADIASGESWLGAGVVVAVVLVLAGPALAVYGFIRLRDRIAAIMP
jgi:hypothetical protein